MEEYQLTLQGYEEAKASIKENLFGIGKSFVMIGWQLTRIEASGRFREDGYSSLTEFAKAEYNMSADNVSKFKKVYETFSVPGDRPEIQEKYKNFEFSKLVDMRQLPEEDRSHLHPETYREDIRDLKEYNKEQENNPARLLNWQQEQHTPEQILKDTIFEYFRNKKKTLNTLYASEAYSSNSIKEMADIVYKDKSTLKTDNAFLMFHKYPTPLFAKIGQNEAEDLSWEDFLRTMREMFDPLAAGGHTYEAVFEGESQEIAYEENDHCASENAETISDSKSTENLNKNEEKDQEIALKSGNMHEKRFPNCIYKHEEACVSNDCQGCSMEKAWKKEKKEERQKGKENYPHYDSNEVFDPTTARMVRSFLDCGYTSLLPGGTKRFHAMGVEFAAVYRPGRGDFVFYDQFGRTICYVSKTRMETEYQNLTTPVEEFAPAQQKNEILPSVGRCAYDPRKTCTLTEEQKLNPGNGENCNEKCCWNCSMRGGCKLECDASTHRPEMIETASNDTDQIPRQDNITNHPEYMPAQQTKSECCQQAAENRDERQWEIEDDGSFADQNPKALEKWPPELNDIPIPSESLMKDILASAEAELKDFLSIADQGVPKRTILEKQIITGGLRLIRNAVKACQELDFEQQPLEIMRNDTERKMWLRTYKLWGIWYEDKHTGARYYKYDFENGARLIVEEYDPEPKWSQWCNPGESYYMHLVGGPEPKRNDHIPKWTYHEKYNKFPNSETELVEFLKELQKVKK